MTDQQEASPPRRVLIVTASVGAGHNQVARAITESLAACAPQMDVQTADSMDFVPGFFRAYYAGGFALAMTRFGRSYGAGFWLFDRPQRPGRGLFERMRLAWERKNLARLRDLLLQTQPDLVVNTHFVAAPMIGRLIETGELRCPQIVVATDIRVHRWWYSRNVEHWFLPHEESAEPLRRWGIEPGRITVSGIPVRLKWTAPLDRGRIYDDWKLPRDRRIVVLTAGTEFTVGPVEKIARGIVAASDACVAVLAGRNKKLLARLGALPEAAQGRIVPVGFTDRNPELLEVCSLIITKPGGVTTAECLAKGVPMVLLKPVPGQELGNARYFASHGAAVITRSARDTVATATQLLRDERKLSQLAASSRALYRPGSQIVCKAIRRMVRQRPQ